MVEELAVASLLLSAIALISCLSVDDKRRIRTMPRALWVFVIVLVPFGGMASWFGFGRPRTLSVRRGGWRAAVGLAQPAGPLAPDDDPDFLRSLRPPRDNPGPRDAPGPPDPPGGA